MQTVSQSISAFLLRKWDRRSIWIHNWAAKLKQSKEKLAKNSQCNKIKNISMLMKTNNKAKTV